MPESKGNVSSAFDRLGFRKTIDALLLEIRELYASDSIPWVVGYSGGKDSTAALSLVWMALSGMDPGDRNKSVHVISTDTLVEQPVVSAWVGKSIEQMSVAATEQKMPITPHLLTPKLNDSFWVNLIGRGYPAPRRKFRWCTERLKISPSNEFILNVVREMERRSSF